MPLASDYAERMLPQIFRKDDPVLDIALPPETRSELEDLLKALPKAVFEADDSLGWVYQFWQAEKKDEVNRSEVKIGADELPAVTQLFTEDYMVLFLLHNTLGAWRAGKVLASNPGLAASAASEDALRAACSVGDVDWTYLRFVRDKAEDGAEGPWRPAAGTFDGWPKAAKDITVLDPCMGSGHFLLFALPILVAFRMAEEDLSERDAIDAVLRNNLFGLEIDPRCTQIAAFNLAFAAWKRVGFRVLPQVNLACSGLAIGVTKAEWLKLAERAVTVADPAAKRDLLGIEQNLLTHGLEERVKNGLEALYDLFAKAPWLGSLIDPRRASADIFREGFEKLEPLLASILTASDTEEAREMAVAAQGMAKAANILAAEFSLVLTNVPYLGRARQDSILGAFCKQEYPLSKADLATTFNERCLSLSAQGGTCALVCTQN
ncbi:Eco57I restriction-modification methylase domain-containing protein [Tistrella bauzanensis]